MISTQTNNIDNKIIYIFWVGGHPMSENRQKSVISIKNNTGCNIRLITDNNVKNYILEDYPLHEAYSYLHPVHKSDYLRCYFMHHYGGGYSDIKPTEHNWEIYFDELKNNENLWVIGYKEVSKESWTCTYMLSQEPKVVKNVEDNWDKLIGNGAFICKSHTSFTTDWYNELNRRMDKYNEVFKKFPRLHKDKSIQITNIETGEKISYIIPWTELLGDILHPLCIKYNTHFNQNLKPPQFINYL